MYHDEDIDELQKYDHIGTAEEEYYKLLLPKQAVMRTDNLLLDVNESKCDMKCRICNLEDERSRLIVPCNCDGKYKYAHRECLDAIRIMSSNPYDYFSCKHCESSYIIKPAFLPNITPRQRVAYWSLVLRDLLVVPLLAIALVIVVSYNYACLNQELADYYGFNALVLYGVIGQITIVLALIGIYSTIKLMFNGCECEDDTPYDLKVTHRDRNQKCDEESGTLRKQSDSSPSYCCTCDYCYIGTCGNTNCDHCGYHHCHSCGHSHSHRSNDCNCNNSNCSGGSGEGIVAIIVAVVVLFAIAGLVVCILKFFKYLWMIQAKHMNIIGRKVFDTGDIVQDLEDMY